MTAKDYYGQLPSQWSVRLYEGILLINGLFQQLELHLLMQNLHFYNIFNCSCFYKGGFVLVLVLVVVDDVVVAAAVDVKGAR